jgi:actin-related protein 6
VFRIDVGGKLLTNHLKEITSYRQWNMMDQTYIMDDVKEKCCYVSADFNAEMELSRYVPPSVNPMPLPRFWSELMAC